MNCSKKMEALSSAIFTKLNDKKLELISSGKEVIDFSIGTPDIPPDKQFVEKLQYETGKIENYKYAISDSKELISAVITWYKTRYNVELEKDEVTSLLGSQSGFAEVALSMLDPGDVVLTQDPGYPIFSVGPYLAGAEIHKMPLLKKNNFLIDFDEIDEEVAKKAKMMVISYPNNPTASIAPKEFYEKLVKFAKKYDIAVLHDNAYSELVFDGKVGGSFLDVDGAKEIGIEFNSFSKTYSIPGCRIAFAVGNKYMIKQLKALKSHVDYGMFLPFQKAAITVLEGSGDYVDKVRNTYETRRNVLINGLNKIGWNIDMTAGSMFVWAKIPSKYESSMKFTLDLMEKTGVIVVPGSSFGNEGEGFVRMALVQDEEHILKAIQNIKNSDIVK